MSLKMEKISRVQGAQSPRVQGPSDQLPRVEALRIQASSCPQSSFSGVPYKRYVLIHKFAAKTSCKEFVKVIWK